MIAEVIPRAYDYPGTKIGRPKGKRIRVFHPTFPMGRYLSGPLTHRFEDIEALRTFLSRCRYVSDQDQFGKADYWLPPEEFEQRRRGDCEDFALYAWRQLMDMGFQSRFVVGAAGRYGAGHAWVTFQRDGRLYLLEPLAFVFKKLPRLSALRYCPEISVACTDGRIAYYSHKKVRYHPSVAEATRLVAEWLFFWGEKLILAGFLMLSWPFKRLTRRWINSSCGKASSKDR